MSKADEAIDSLKSEATKLLDGMFKIPDGCGSDATRRIVDCIVMASALTCAKWQEEALEGNDG